MTMTAASAHRPSVGVGKCVSVIVLNWNGRQYLARCLDSLIMQSYPNMEIIVMDNDSTDGSVEFVRNEYPRVSVVASERNLGVAEGNNVAARQARGDYLFLINSDAWCEHPDTIETLVRRAENMPSAAIIGCQVLNLDGSIQDIGARIDAFGFPRGLTPRPGRLSGVIEQLFYACACAVLIRSDVFWAIGGFDGRYFWSHEEVDLAWQARLRGYTIVTDMDAVVTHVGGASMAGGAPGKEARYLTTTARIYYRERCTLATLLKNYSMRSLLRILPIYVGINVAEVLALLCFRQRVVAWQILRAYWWNLRQLPDTLRARRRVQRHRCVPDSEIARHFWPGIQKYRSFRSMGMPRIENVASGATRDIARKGA